ELAAFADAPAFRQVNRGVLLMGRFSNPRPELIGLAPVSISRSGADLLARGACHAATDRRLCAPRSRLCASRVLEIVERGGKMGIGEPERRSGAVGTIPPPAAEGATRTQ